MTEPGNTVNIQGGVGIAPTADGKALLVIGLTIAGAQFVTPPMDPDAAAAFVNRLAENVNQAATDARRHNLGLIVPTASGNGHGGNLDHPSAVWRRT